MFLTRCSTRSGFGLDRCIQDTQDLACTSTSTSGRFTVRLIRPKGSSQCLGTLPWLSRPRHCGRGWFSCIPRSLESGCAVFAYKPPRCHPQDPALLAKVWSSSASSWCWRRARSKPGPLFRPQLSPDTGHQSTAWLCLSMSRLPGRRKTARAPSMMEFAPTLLDQTAFQILQFECQRCTEQNGQSLGVWCCGRLSCGQPSPDWPINRQTSSRSMPMQLQLPVACDRAAAPSRSDNEGTGEGRGV